MVRPGSSPNSAYLVCSLSETQAIDSSALQRPRTLSVSATRFSHLGAILTAAICLLPLRGVRAAGNGGYRGLSLAKSQTPATELQPPERNLQSQEVQLPIVKIKTLSFVLE
ncbi:hypothetical protein SLE2022_054480 [Rubroshorea leprosula]